MADYDNTNRGSIWKNEKKESDRHPDFTGSLNVEGVEYWVSAWKRKPDQSERAPALSFSIKAKDAKPSEHQQAKSNGYAPTDDDIPFN